MRLTALILVISLAGAAQAVPQCKTPEGAGIVYGSELGVGIGAPKGWIFDSESAVSQGLYAVMYPEGSSWADAREVMYVNVARLDEGQTVESFISEDVASFREKAPDLVVKVAEPIAIASGANAEVRHFSGDSWGNHEAVAYIASGSSVAIYVLSCRSKGGFEKSLPAFQEMVGNSFLAAMAFEK